MTHRRNSTLILIEDDKYTAGFSALMTADGYPVSTENTSLQSVNGQAHSLMSRHDLVIFEVDPNRPEDLSAVDAVAGTDKSEVIFVALTEEDVSITEARRLRSRGVDEVLPKTIDAEDLKDIVTDLRNTKFGAGKAAASSSVGAGQMVAVVQSAGGSGATTAAVNLAVSLASKKGRFSKQAGAKVALIDLDVQFGSVGVLMDLEDNGGFLEMIESAAVPDFNYLKGIMQPHSSGVDVLVAPRQIAPLTALDPNQFATLFDVLKASYDYVVVDMPRALVEWLEPVVSRLDELLIVTDTSVPSIRQAKRVTDFYREDNITLTARVLVSGESKPLIKTEQIREGEKLLEMKFVHWIPQNTKLARKAVDLGQPIAMTKAGSDIGKAYSALAKTLAEQKINTGVAAS